MAIQENNKLQEENQKLKEDLENMKGQFEDLKKENEIIISQRGLTGDMSLNKQNYGDFAHSANSAIYAK